MLSIFSCDFWSFVFSVSSLEKCLLKYFVLKLGYFFNCWVIMVLYLFCTQVHYQIWFSDIFPILSFNFLMLSFEAQKFLILATYCLFSLLLLMLLVSYLRFHCQIQGNDLSLCFFLRVLWNLLLYSHHWSILN